MWIDMDVYACGDILCGNSLLSLQVNTALLFSNTADQEQHNHLIHHKCLQRGMQLIHYSSN